MKEALLKKRMCGIPVALLLALLLVVSTAFAWYCFTRIDSNTNVQEPLSITETKEFSENMYPGELNTWTFDITNSANVAYDIKADWTLTAPSGVTITKFVGGTTIETGEELKDGFAEFKVFAAAGVPTPCSLEITADKDATPGDVSVSLALSRQ